jgi:hypothetical protein
VWVIAVDRSALFDFNERIMDVMVLSELVNDGLDLAIGVG